MEYKGELYGKVGTSYFPLIETTDDFDNLKKEVELLRNDAKPKRPTYDEFSKVLNDCSFEATWDYFVHGIKCECNDPQHSRNVTICLKCLKPL